MAEKTKKKKRHRLSGKVGRLEKFYTILFVRNLFFGHLIHV